MKSNDVSREEKIRRAKAYIAKIPGAVEGQAGDHKTFVVACLLRNGFALDHEDALSILRDWNKSCTPPWSEEELIEKLENASRYGKGPAGDKLNATPLSDDGEDEEKSTATKIVELCKGFELFHSQEKQPFATIKNGGHLETHEIASHEFELFVAGLYYRATGRPPGAAISHAIQVLAAKALFEGARRTVYTRIKVQEKCVKCEGCEACESVVIDLGDEHWSSIGLSSTGWTIQGSTSVKFRRSISTKPLPKPVGHGNAHRIFEFLNLESDSDQHLILAWLISVLISKGPSPALIIQGQQGSAKSFTTRLLKQLVDPTIPPVRTLPKDERDLAIAAVNNWVLTFDNLSGLKPAQSDALCRVVTGGGLGTRSLYTNGEEFIFDVRRPMILNGIDDIATRPDLLDRAIVLNLPVIDGVKRKTEEEILAAFESAHPEILGGLLDLAANVLGKLNSVVLPSAPRMADYAKIGTAYEQLAGLPKGHFLNIFNSNRQEAIENEIEKDMIAQAVINLAGKLPDGWSGSISDLHGRIREYVSFESPGFERSIYFPQGPQAMSNRLRRLSPHLKTRGVEITWVGREGGTGRNKIQIRKVPTGGTATRNQEKSDSPPSHPSQPMQTTLPLNLMDLDELPRHNPRGVQ